MCAVGVVFLGIFALWCNETTGSPFLSPYAFYSKVYFPDDVMGFGLAGGHALRALPPDMRNFNDWVQAVHASYTPQTFRHQALLRLKAIAEDMWATREFFIPFGALGLLAGSAEIWFAVVSAFALFAAYLTFGHPPAWTVYYVEIQPVLACASALGVWRAIRFITEGGSPLRRRAPSPSARTALAMGALTVVLLPYVSRSVPTVRDGRMEDSEYHRNFRALVASVPGDHIIVFVRYRPNHVPHHSLITNEPDFAHARVWTAYDYGTDDLRLMHLAPDRVPYLFDDARQTMIPLDRAGAPQYDRALRLPVDRVAIN
jgi:hypothetical protein